MLARSHALTLTTLTLGVLLTPALQAEAEHMRRDLQEIATLRSLQENAAKVLNAINMVATTVTA